MAMWSRFDIGEIDEDFARIAGLGLDIVRFFLLWDDFAPTPDAMSQEALRNFERVLDRAAARGLRTMPTLFCGHMSGVNWLPEWTLDPAHRSERFRTITRSGFSPLGIGDFYAGRVARCAAHVRACRGRTRARPCSALRLGSRQRVFESARTSVAGRRGTLERGVDARSLRNLERRCDGRHPRRRRHARPPHSAVVDREPVDVCHDARLFGVQRLCARSLRRRSRPVPCRTHERMRA